MSQIDKMNENIVANKMKQVVIAQSSNYLRSLTVIPFDNTIPQQTDGDKF